MLPKISCGRGGTYGLIRYLYGPGKRNEHSDPHLVASWNGFAPDPGRNPEHTVAKLARQLDTPVAALPPDRLQKKTKTGETKRRETVWHCSVRADPGDRHLTDVEWADIARRILHATSIAPDGDTKACRWVAVRHAEDHIHIAATLVRQDGRLARRDFDFTRAQAEARRIEHHYGLRRLNPGDGTAAQRATSKEHYKAERRGLPAPARDQLRHAIRDALTGAADEQEFFRRLTEQGVRIKKRTAPSGDVTGYSVALPGDRNRHREPIWFSASKLAPDLSLPQIRKRLTAHPLDQPPAPRQPARARRQATTTAHQALTTLRSENETAAADQLVAFGEVLDALAQTSPASTRADLHAAAMAFERATRSHTHAQHAHHQALRQAARDLLHAGPALGRGEDSAATAMLLDILIFFALAAAHWHAARHHAQQAAASHHTAQLLRTAYHTAAHPHLTALNAHGQHLPAHTRERHATVIRTVLPDHADRILTEPGWPALAATLTHTEHAGHDPAALLHRAVEERELDTAESLTDVLVWCLRHHADLPAAVNPPQPTKPRTRPHPGTPAARPTHYTPPSTHVPGSSRHR
ncbi:relaxase/mobilization nuclease domain-containing protein [Streptomyces sp. B1866]|uniref:relaxase/mobilization nuclease domain-containing protein n=1 Tax=Streptomyces sp. B1866 TaxID=3075431 RepID=UPI00288E521A|nr:relaxase/mobilization nuclease domain-containing protein [Streptomyces sp. B1866]MDT3397628.1 relaxase/mobilization nuclease domain-containing protein [Streptomyces sp. B1866]